jgi:hypothetical protein
MLEIYFNRLIPGNLSVATTATRFEDKNKAEIIGLLSYMKAGKLTS